MESKDESTKRSAKSLLLLTALALAGAEIVPPSAFKNVCVFAVDNL
jgi:hypothetical protein